MDTDSNDETSTKKRFSKEFWWSLGFGVLAVAIGLLPSAITMTPTVVAVLRWFCGLLILAAALIFAHGAGRLRGTLRALGALSTLAIVAYASYSFGAHSQRVRAESKSHQVPPARANTVTVLPLTQSVFIYQMATDFAHLTTDGDLVFNVRAFNGSGDLIVLSKLTEGAIRWRIDTTSHLVSFADPPQIDPQSQLTVPFAREVQFSFKQHTPPSTADEIFKAFSAGRPVEFSFGDLKISARRKALVGEEQTLRLWDGVICRKSATGETSYSHVVSVFATIHTPVATIR
jgi:hypothetical protein